jgi:hypothetical protein
MLNGSVLPRLLGIPRQFTGCLPLVVLLHVISPCCHSAA